MNRARALLTEFPLEFCRLPAPAPQLKACVVMPARDEAENIGAALDALAAQRDLNGAPLPAREFEILLLANNCRDETAAIARAWNRAHPRVALHVVEARFGPDRACVGHARRMAMNAACARLHEAQAPSEPAPRAICSTDADTRVSPFWLAHTLEEMRLGAQAVGGRILLGRAPGDGATRKTYLLDTAYRLWCARLEAKIDPQLADPWPRHFQFFGASLAINPETYAQIGGLPRARCLEDMALEAELNRRDIPVRHSPNVVALTSARRAGRVQTGLSTQLDEWATASGAWLVPSGAQVAWQARLRRQLREGFGVAAAPREADIIARELMMPGARLQRAWRESECFGALWQDAWNAAWNNPDLRAHWAPIEVEVALAQLRAMLQGLVEK